MFIEDVPGLLLAEFALEHVLDGELFRLLNEGKDFVQFCRFEDRVGFDDGDCVGQVLLFGVEEEGLLLEL